MKKWIAGPLLVVSIVLLSISIYSMMGMFGAELKERQTYEELKDIFEDTEPVDSKEEADGGHGRPANAGLLALHGENPDCIAWIKIPDTAIDYPVMFRPEEKNYYLHRDFYGEYSAGGSLFLSEICDPETSDNLIIYGHHMSSGTMFAALENYKDRSFYEEHPFIQYSTLQGEETYQILAAFSLSVGTGQDFAYYAFQKAGTEKEYSQFVLECLDRSYYPTGITASYGDKLLTLSTCEYSHTNGRMVVVARKCAGGGD